MRYFLSLLFLGICLTLEAQQTVIPCGHSHNDYKHKRPLFDALDNGFMSIEVDIWDVDNEFIAAHTKLGIRKKNTLEKLYLQPLNSIVEENNGSVYKNSDAEVILMIDLKGNWTEEQLKALEAYVLKYKSLLTVYEDGKKKQGAVRLLLSGDGARYSVADDNPRFFSIDGRFDDFHSELSENILPRTSASYKGIFNWRGIRKMPQDQRDLLHELVDEAHQNNHKIRFWAAPNKKKVWKELLDAGVDWVNVDKLEKFRKWYLAR